MHDNIAYVTITTPLTGTTRPSLDLNSTSMRPPLDLRLLLLLTSGICLAGASLENVEMMLTL